MKYPPSFNSNEHVSLLPQAQAAVAQGEYLPARALRTRYGISAMTLHRWLRNPDLGFPQPIIINARRYWRVEALRAWERER
jgi:hypothetical protein